MRVAPSLASQHLTGCRSCCSKCFYTTYCFRGSPPGHPPALAKHRFPYPLRDRKTNVEMAVGAQTKTLMRHGVRKCYRAREPGGGSAIIASTNAPDALFFELEKLYWEGVGGELENVIWTLKVWQKPEFAKVSVEDEDDDFIHGFGTFIEQESRAFATRYGKRKDERIEQNR
ncbi:uncharacterized protein P884DRAFT_273186 [Thermothelomyces heterothallicus CBS 202.75]|uniref:uncharacterized protein n=1 Tax=Thermothelomyces heterothallicus CBS 202.75 TaxID=1149848 RepID=UPI003742B03D